MKKLFFLATILIALTSCSSNRDDDNKNTNYTTDKILLLSLNKNGILLEKYNYYENGNLKETLLYDNGVYSAKVVCEYENGKIKKQVKYDKYNNILNYHLYTVDGNKILKDIEYNPSNVKTDENNYLYDTSNNLIEVYRPSFDKSIKYNYLGENKYEYDIYLSGYRVTHATIYTDDKIRVNKYNFPWYGKSNNHNDIKSEYNFYDTGDNETIYSSFTYNALGYPLKEVTKNLVGTNITYEYVWSK